MTDRPATSASPSHGTMNAFFTPRTVALIGASSKPGKWGHHVAVNLLGGSDGVAVRFVNPSGGRIEGQPVQCTPEALPEVPDLAVIALPAGLTKGAVDACLELGTRNFVIMSGGFSELDAEGANIEASIVARIRQKGGLLLGPNCIGFQDSAAGVYATRITYPVGRLGIVSQSGLVTHELSRYALAQGLGFSRAINLGNQAIIGLAEAVGSFVDSPETDALIIYCEGLKNGPEVLTQAERVRASGIPVIMLTVGASEAAARSALSHTGAIVSDIDGIDAACRAAGIHRTESTKETIAVAASLASQANLEPGKRVGIVTDGGGLGSLCAEAVTLAGLEVPQLSAELQERLSQVSGPRVGRQNPVDTAGEADLDMGMYGRLVTTLLNSGEVDGVMLTGHFGANSRDENDLGKDEVKTAIAMAEDRRSSGRGLIIHAIYPEFETGKVLREGGVPVFRDLSDAVAGMKAILTQTQGSGLPQPVARVCEDGDLDTSYWSIRERLCNEGISYPPGRIVESADVAAEYAEETGYPVVAKAVGLLHKTDLGGVRLGLKTPEALREAVSDLKTAFPDSPITVEKQIDLSNGIEMLVGARIDPQLGALVSVAFGGVFAEILASAATEMAPVGFDTARGMILSLKGAEILSGARGKPPLDIDALAMTIVRLSQVVSALRDEIAEIEINPVVVLADGAVALDARCIARH